MRVSDFFRPLPSATVAALFVTSIAFAQTMPPADSAPIPPETGLSPTDVIRLLMPDYDERFAEACEHGNAVGGPLEYAGATIESYVRTDLGISGRSFLVASIYFIRGDCEGGCVDHYVGAIDLRSHEVFARYEGGGWMGDSDLRVFRLFPEPAPLTIAFAQSTGSRGGFGRDEEIWIQPDLSNLGEDAEPLKSFLVSSYNYGNRGGSALRLEATVEEPDREHVVHSRSVTTYGLELGDGRECEEPPDPPTTSWYEGADVVKEVFSRTSFSAESARSAAIERNEYYRPDRGELFLFRSDARRVDSEGCSGFPFDLPIRAAGNSWRPVSKSGKSTSGQGELALSSRKGKWTAKAFKERHHGDVSLSIDSGNGRILRKILMTRGDRFRGEIEALGTSADSSRVFAIVSFGEDDRALLSFSVKGADDWWEETLSGTDHGFRNGFVLKRSAP